MASTTDDPIHERTVPMHSAGPSAWRRLRARQIRFTTYLLNAAEAMPGGHRLLGPLTHWAPSAVLIDWLSGFERLFDDLTSANAAARPYANGGHAHPQNIRLHQLLGQTTRASDYAALFHLRHLVGTADRVFDVGGNVGNLFYSYDRYLRFSQALRWHVYELPAVAVLGGDIARERGERRLTFGSDFSLASGSDLLIASGSLHYLEAPLWPMLAKLARPPGHVLINRTPLIDGPTRATNQDGGSYVIACMLYNRAELIEGFRASGYELADSWQAPELELRLPGRPEFSARPYSGLYFRHRDTCAGDDTPAPSLPIR